MCRNNLDGALPGKLELRFCGVGLAGAVVLDLIVSAVHPCALSQGGRNGLSASKDFGVINLRGGSSCILDFSFVDEVTGENTVLDSFSVSFLDFDRSGVPYGSISEVLEIGSGNDGYTNVEFSDASAYLVLNGTADDKIKIQATSVGNGEDNPVNRMELSKLQQRKAVTFTFRGKSTFKARIATPTPQAGSKLGRYFFFTLDPLVTEINDNVDNRGGSHSDFTSVADVACAPFDAWPRSSLDCGHCSASVASRSYAGTCDAFCQSFGHSCQGARRLAGPSCTGGEASLCFVAIMTPFMRCICRNGDIGGGNVGSNYVVAYTDAWCEDAHIFDNAAVDLEHHAFNTLSECEAKCNADPACQFVMWGWIPVQSYHRCVLFPSCNQRAEYCDGSPTVYRKPAPGILVDTQSSHGISLYLTGEALRSGGLRYLELSLSLVFAVLTLVFVARLRRRRWRLCTSMSSSRAPPQSRELSRGIYVAVRPHQDYEDDAVFSEYEYAVARP